ncbi:nucleotidyl transferase AbiEii/AbiGii toxin family protein [Kineosporia rhizophila]|uniref:nucleotidyl transferase AbiEii/AbiGii toxin family protein n=1 Tax=Kineosporia rhizophila TaxID=84633 RepID=UPI001E39F2AA|nr:nucleotidyl transferase AbiEii/AbiGii toxin family protein [Kineosporia rhizophila]MCE0534125.1 nucleotidyl transferase AbiEii/AbiGii toxin family protein [Kineosporia rhizophila]
MTADWDGRRPGSGREVPQTPLSDEALREQMLPRTFRTVGSEEAVQRYVFDPANLHNSNAYRASDPTFRDPAVDRAWREARWRALHLVLAAIVETPWAENLVLRGSTAMSLWFPESARQPRDLDFVVVPHTWSIHGRRTGAMVSDIAQAAQERAGRRDARLTIAADQATLGDIWTYDRVPGRRMVLPWSSPGLPGGDVQIDFVFNEPLPEPPQPLALPDGGQVQAASPALSLAWKMLWLISDMHPQGKDLYDAVLLAEQQVLSRPLLDEVFRLFGEHEPWWRERRVGLEDVIEAVRQCEDDHFVMEYPSLEAVAAGLPDRLITALRPAFADQAQ